MLALLYGQPDHSFHTNEILRLTGSGTGAIQRELDKLSSVGLITVEAIGNQKRYAANRTSPLFSELRGIVLKTLLFSDIGAKSHIFINVYKICILSPF